MTQHLGDFPVNGMVDFKWSSNSAAGASITRATDGTISAYIGNSATQLTTGITDTEDFDSLTGVHHCRIDLSSSGSYAAGSEVQIVLSGSTIDGETVNAVLASFSIERAGGVLALLKGTNSLAQIRTDIAGVQSDTNDLQTRVPAALVSGRMDVSVGAMAANVLTAAATATDFGTEVATAVWANATRTLSALDEDTTTLDLDATIRGALGLASANLDTQLGAIDTVVDRIDGTIAVTSDGPVFTALALQNAPTGGGGGSTPEDIADAVWSAALPGAFTSGEAGNILAGRASQASVDTIDGIVDAILVDTAEIGAAGAGLTALPWNAAWDAEVQSECADAIAAYDPPTFAEMSARTLASADYATATALATVDTVVDSILADTGTDGVVVASLSAGAVDSILDEVVEGSTTLRQSIRGHNAALMGKASGLETTGVAFRNIADTKDVITATVDADGNRSAVSLDLT